MATAWRGQSVWTPRSHVSRTTAGPPHTSHSVAESSSSAQRSSTNGRGPRTSYHDRRPQRARQRNEPGGSVAAAAVEATRTIPTQPGTGASSLARPATSTAGDGRSISESLERGEPTLPPAGFVRHLFGGDKNKKNRCPRKNEKRVAGSSCWSLVEKPGRRMADGGTAVERAAVRLPPSAVRRPLAYGPMASFRWPPSSVR